MPTTILPTPLKHSWATPSPTLKITAPKPFVPTEPGPRLPTTGVSHLCRNLQEVLTDRVRPDFGTTGHMHMAASLLTATGSTQEMFSSNSNYNKTGLFHMYGSGFVEKFNYGDCGPNKFTATANELIFMGNELDSEFANGKSILLRSTA